MEGFIFILVYMKPFTYYLYMVTYNCNTNYQVMEKKVS